MKYPTLALLLLTCLCAQAQEPKTVPFLAGAQVLATQRNGMALPSNCSFADKNLPADTVVIAAGSYSGHALDLQIDQSGHQATQFDVAVHADKPVALLLASYEPTVWSIGWTKGTRIVAVYATGYHRQAVAGLPKGTPVITSTYDEKSACGYHTLGSSDGLEWVNPLSRTLFGKPVTRVYNKSPNGIIDIVESKREKTDYVTSPDVTPASFKDLNAPLAGKAGLDAAVTKGLIRPLKDADLEPVRAVYRALAVKAATLGVKSADVPPVAGAAPKAPPDVRIPRLTTYNGYVVLKPFAIPAGLFGGNAAGFLVPKGVPAPTGNPGHSIIMDLNKNPPCSGMLCGM